MDKRIVTPEAGERGTPFTLTYEVGRRRWTSGNGERPLPSKDGEFDHVSGGKRAKNANNEG